VIYIAEDCPGCQVLAQVMRRAADSLAGGAGAVVGGALGSAMTARTGDPSHIARMRTAGALAAPRLIENTALAIRDKVKQSKKQKKRSKMLSKNLATVNKRARKKNGALKKGWSQKRIMQTAHRMCK